VSNLTRVGLMLLASLTLALPAGAEKTKKVEGFGGVIAESYADSKEWWAPETRPPEGAPNVIIFLLDDVGFAQVGSFGGLIETPNIDKLAENGLRFNNFHTTALCSPSRASLMAQSPLDRVGEPRADGDGISRLQRDHA